MRLASGEEFKIFAALNLADLQANVLARCLKFMTRRLLNFKLVPRREDAFT